MFLIGVFVATLTVVTGIIGLANWAPRSERTQIDLRRKSLEIKKAGKVAAAEKKKKSKKEHVPGPDDWVCIGRLQKIIIYPIDDGYGLTENRAHCTRHGLASQHSVRWRLYHYVENNKLRGYHDRVCVAYHNDTKRVLVRNPDARLLHDTELLQLINTQLKTFQQLLKTSTIEYENQTKGLRVYDLDHTVTSYIERLIGQNTGLKIGYRDRESKTSYNTAMRHFFNTNPPNPDWTLDGFSANFSSYSLVNSDQIERLTERCGRHDISFWNFRPNLVVENNGTPYLEENIIAVKIGNVKFSEITPCTHTSSINYDIRIERGDDEEEPFNYLSRNRRLCDIRPDLSSSLSSPIFGINMELEKLDSESRLQVRTASRMIRLNDRVFVKLRQIRRSSPRPGPSILKKSSR